MHVTPRGYLTSGIAVLGAGVIALSPVQPVSDHLAAVPQRAVETLAVDLAATIDPITPWVDTFKTAGANIKTLVEFYMQKPLPLLQTIVAKPRHLRRGTGERPGGSDPRTDQGQHPDLLPGALEPGSDHRLPGRA